MRRILALLTILMLPACTYVTEPTVVMYPTKLDLPLTELSLNIGASYGLGVYARVIGKSTIDAGDSISVTIRNPAILQNVGDWSGRSLCGDPAYNFPAVCINRGLDVRGLKVGQTYIVFKVGGVSDSIEVNVRLSQKG